MTTMVLRAATMGLPGRLLAGLNGVADVFSNYVRAVEAAKAWDSLSAMSDSQLAKRGLAREDIPDAVLKVISPPH